MSIKAMGYVWDTTLKPTQKLLLMAIADRCNDMGECYPGVDDFHKKVGVSHRRIQQLFSELEESGELYIKLGDGIKTKSGSTNRYYMKKYRKSIGIIDQNTKTREQQLVENTGWTKPKPKGVKSTSPDEVKSTSGHEMKGISPDEVKSTSPKPSVDSSLEPSDNAIPAPVVLPSPPKTPEPIRCSYAFWPPKKRLSEIKDQMGFPDQCRKIVDAWVNTCAIEYEKVDGRPLDEIIKENLSRIHQMVIDGYTPENIIDCIRDVYTKDASGDGFWKKQHAPVTLKKIQKDMPGFLKEQAAAAAAEQRRRDAVIKPDVPMEQRATVEQIREARRRDLLERNKSA